jgi:mono/diheme cytochrome c family protein
LADQDLIAIGETVCVEHCASCHGPGGAGSEGIYPRLAGSDSVLGDPEPLIERVIFGRGAMPPFGDELSDLEIAAALSYVRNTWGNDARVVSPEDVEAVR